MRGESSIILADPTSGQRKAVPFRCRDWGCARPTCRQAAARRDRARVLAGLLKHDLWAYAILTTRWTGPGRYHRAPAAWNRLRTGLAAAFPGFRYVLTWEVSRSGRLHANLVFRGNHLVEQELADPVGFLETIKAKAVSAGFGPIVKYSRDHGLLVRPEQRPNVAAYITKVEGGLASYEEEDPTLGDGSGEERDWGTRLTEDLGRGEFDEVDYGYVEDSSGAGDYNGDDLDQLRRATCQLPLDAPPRFRKTTSSRGLLPPRGRSGFHGEYMKEPFERVEAMLAREVARTCSGGDAEDDLTAIFSAATGALATHEFLEGRILSEASKWGVAIDPDAARKFREWYEAPRFAAVLIGHVVHLLVDEPRRSAAREALIRAALSAAADCGDPDPRPAPGTPDAERDTVRAPTTAATDSTTPGGRLSAPSPRRRATSVERSIKPSDVPRCRRSRPSPTDSRDRVRQLHTVVHRSRGRACFAIPGACRGADEAACGRGPPRYRGTSRSGSRTLL